MSMRASWQSFENLSPERVMSDTTKAYNETIADDLVEAHL